MKSDSGEVLKFKLGNEFIATKAYAMGLNEALSVLTPFLSDAQRNDLCTKKLSLETSPVSEQAYIQSAVELTVCAHYARFYSDEFIYEEKVNPPKDVDCSVRIDGFKYNIEVKCADFVKKELVDKASGFKIGAMGRLDDYAQLVEQLQELFSSDGHVLSEQRHMDNNLKTFLVSAHSKFAAVTPDNELNILIVACDDAMDMQKWHSYLFGVQGLFTNDSYADRAAYDRVDMVVLTNLYHRHKDPASKHKITGHWHLSEAFCILCANPFSEKPHATAYEFSKTVRHFNNEWNDYLSGADDILKGIGIPAFVGSELQAKGMYYFQPYDSETDEAESEAP